MRIVYTVRHQADYIQSIWLQLAVIGKAPRFEPFLEAALAQHLASGLWVDHGKVIDHVLTGFSPDQLVILDHEATRCHPDGVAGLFLDLMGSPLRFADLQDLEPREADVSPDPLATWLAHSTRWPSPSGAGLVRAFQTSLDHIRERHGRKRTTLYSRAQYRQIEETFAADNDKLAGWLQANQPGTTLSPPAAPDTLLFREDLTIADWIGLTRQVAMGRAKDGD
ncbi:hypothetical protein [Paracoccus benzoatiresistens]|uniref:Sulfotransferase family protein n=1 Tax=Paracoccus benzoatiresistens TaxID=2997341 RepID=A0ABT4J5N4_9RHOB|nr:hypothetical protein [Paracoccus sp. EF6]MCZ0962437.1 hypothetical protein [Paracoccus sp. EF6]